MAKELKDMTVAEAKASGQEQAYSNLVAGYGRGVPSTLPAPTAPTISVDMLQGTTPPPQLPPAPTTTKVGSEIVPQPITTPTVTPTDTKGSLRQTLEQGLAGMFGKTIDTSAERERLDIENKEKLARDQFNRIQKLDQDYQKQLEALEANPRGITTSALNAETNKLNREYARQRADELISYNILQGDYQAAERTLADYKADLQDQRTWEMNAFKLAFDFVQNDMTESEKMQAQQTWQEKQDVTNFEQQKQFADYQAKIQQDKMVFEAKLQQADPLYQAKLREAQMGGVEAPKVVKINGVDSVWNTTTGQFEPIKVAGGGAGELVLASAKQSIDNTAKLLDNKYLSTAVGPNPLARISLSNIVTGGKDDFISGVGKLVKNLSLDTLIQAKEKGATFGALSDTEMKILSGAATTINDKAVTNKKGEIVGYKGSEKAFKDELQSIQNFAKLDYLLKGGYLEEVNAFVTPDGAIMVTNNDGTITELRKANQY
jgi:hypothetical protein